MPRRSDTEELVRRAKAGERAAFDELARIHGDRLAGWIRTRMGEKVRRSLDVSDVVQDTYLRAYGALDRFVYRNERSFFRWLCTIAEHRIWNAAQKRTNAPLSLSDDPPADSVSPSRGLRREERFERLETALENLNPDERAALELSRFEGIPAREIAARMSVSERTVKRLLSRGLKKLRVAMGHTESFHLPHRRLDEDREDR